ncbi:hypothetical protein JL722_2933 [Aureococcus anophagefferens]|nr:hypothetical protein JL722_2933 [Aureococcus anophagefferens]
MSWYTVTGRKGCQLRAGSLLSSRKVCEVECGTRVRVETVKRVVAGDREVERCEIVLPVKGWASLRLLRREDEDPAAPAAVEEPWPAGAKVRLEASRARRTSRASPPSSARRPRPPAATSATSSRSAASCAAGAARVLEHAPEDDVYAYEAEAEAAAEAATLFAKMRRWPPRPRTPSGAPRTPRPRRAAPRPRPRPRAAAADGAAAPAGGVADDAAPTARTALAKGTLVIVKGLTRLADLNGRSGVVAGAYDEAAAAAAAFADKTYRVRWENLDVHPTQRARDKLPKGDEVVFVTEEEAREGMYAVKLDPPYYDKAIDRVLAAENEFEVLDLPVEAIRDASTIKRQYRKISLAVHPDKNRHPQANAAFRKTYGAFETLSDPKEQRKLLVALGVEKETSPFAWTADDDAAFADDDDDDDQQFQWWWEASVSEAQKLHDTDGAIWIDAREGRGRGEGTIPGAWSVPMKAVFDYGIVAALGTDLIHEILSTRRHQPIVVFSAVATPFSRCRSFCRFILRAGHMTLKAKRFHASAGALRLEAQGRQGGHESRLRPGPERGADRFAGVDKWQMEDGGDAD